jgi:hypothetical protein
MNFNLADSWPRSLSDQMAREDWQWMPEYDLTTTCLLMMESVNEKLKAAQKLDDVPQLVAMK